MEDTYDNYDSLYNCASENELRQIVSSHIDQVLKVIYNNISDDGFDINLNLSQIHSLTLMDFGIIASGFMGINNFEVFANQFNEQTLKKMINGTFVIKELTLKEATELIQKSGNQPKVKKDRSQVTTLYTIQDAKYVVVQKNGKNTLVLQTPPLDYEFDVSHKITLPEVFARVRNALAHGLPYEVDSRMFLFFDNGHVRFSKMWLRGYSELFARVASVIDAKKLKSAMLEESQKSENALNSFDEINKMLSAVKGHFPKEIISTFFRVNNFVRYRLNQMPNFFNESTERKIEILVNIIDKNPNFLVGTSESINPSIIYSLQQLVANELEKRDEIALPNEDDDVLDRADAFLDSQALEEIKKRYERLGQKYKNNYHKLVELKAKFEQEVAQFQSKINGYSQEIENKLKLSSAQMELFDPSVLKDLPIEVAVNTVSLMGFNSLVFSSFYEDLLSKTDYKNLSPAQEQFFNRFNLDKLSYESNGRTFGAPYSNEDKCFILRTIRHAISHGFITYQIPNVKQGQTGSFKNAIMSFYIEDGRGTVSATVQDFYELFADEDFTKERSKTIITGEIKPIQDDIPEKYRVKKPSTGPGDNGEN